MKKSGSRECTFMSGLLGLGAGIIFGVVAIVGLSSVYFKTFKPVSLLGCYVVKPGTIDPLVLEFGPFTVLEEKDNSLLVSREFNSLNYSMPTNTLKVYEKVACPEDFDYNRKQK